MIHWQRLVLVVFLARGGGYPRSSGATSSALVAQAFTTPNNPPAGTVARSSKDTRTTRIRVPLLAPPMPPSVASQKGTSAAAARHRVLMAPGMRLAAESVSGRDDHGGSHSTRLRTWLNILIFWKNRDGRHRQAEIESARRKKDRKATKSGESRPAEKPLQLSHHERRSGGRRFKRAFQVAASLMAVFVARPLRAVAGGGGFGGGAAPMVPLER